MNANMRKAGLTGVQTLKSWYKCESRENMNWPRAYGDVEKARDKIIEHIADLGGVDGIVGFSQGAAMAMLCAEQGALIRARSSRQLRFVAAFSAGPTVFITRGYDIADGACAGLVSFICGGEADSVGGSTYVATMAAKLRGGGATCTEHKWAGEHRMPPSEDEAYVELRKATDNLFSPMELFCMAISDCMAPGAEDEIIYPARPQQSG